MERLARWALFLIVFLNVLATLVSFGESYMGLEAWAAHHTVLGFWAWVWPMMIDTIILVGESALLVSHHFRWPTRHKAWAWMVTFTALAVSVAANTGHVDSADWLSRLTAALPPLALAFCMTVGFGVMKRYYANKPVPSQPVAATPMVPVARTAPLSERTHTGTEPWIESPVLTPPEIPAETPAEDVAERPAPVLPDPDFDLSKTLVSAGLKVTERSFTLPKDSRDPREISLRAKRVRDAVDVDPDISVNALMKMLGCAWQTAKNEWDATMEARGLA